MNKVELIGRLTKDPELKTTQSGVQYTQFTLAVNRPYKNDQGQREADFIYLTAWRKTAELICRYCQKGRMLGVVGTIRTRSWDDNQGNRHYSTDVLVDEFDLLSGGSGGNQDYQSQQAAQPDGGNIPEGFTVVDDDDLPF